MSNKVFNFFRFVPKKRQVRIKKDNGLIFHNPGIGRRLPFYIANLFFLGAIVYGFYLYSPLISAVGRYERNKNKKIVLVNPTITTVPPKTGEIVTPTPVDTSYRIIIPKIQAESEVKENVSPFDPAEYNRVLKENVVAQAAGSFPPGSGKGKSAYIFAHSTNAGPASVRNNAVFYLLGKLELNDQILIKYHGNEKYYRVYDKKVIKPDNLDYLSHSDPEKEVLILQTCWPIGTDWNRLLIFAEPI